MGVETRQANGINLDYVSSAIEGVRAEPRAALITSRVRHRWDDGFAVDGEVEALEQGGQVSRRRHRSRTDWPQPLGADSGPTPGVERVLAALGACVATTYVFKAATQGVRIDELEVVTEAQVDLQGLFELSEAIPARFSNIDIKVRVHSNADDAMLAELGATCTRTSPTYDSVANPVPIRLGVERLG